MDGVAIVYVVLAIAAIATLAFLLHNKYVLWMLYSISFAIFSFVMLAGLWSVENPFYHKIGISITLVASSLFGLLLAIKVVEFITPDVVIGTKFSIVETQFSYGLLNLFAPIISMVVLGIISTGVYLHSFNTQVAQLKDASLAESAKSSHVGHDVPPEVSPGSSEVSAKSAKATLQSAGPSFDCARAASVSERLICEDAELSRMDVDLETLYQRASAVAPDKAEFRRISIERWRQRETGCSDKKCLLVWYRTRHQELQYILSSNEQDSR